MSIPEVVLGLLLATGVWALYGVLSLPDAAAWLQKWQTLAGALGAASVGSIAVYAAVQNTTRAIRHADDLEIRRRKRKRAALRAVLPLALAELITHAEQSAHALKDLLNKFSGGKLPPNTASPNVFRQLPSDTLSTFADFIEYADDQVNVGILEATVAWVQIHEARVREVVVANCNPSGTRLLPQYEIEERIIDAASIYAGAAAVFEYARRQQDQIPGTISWDNVISALRNMQFWDNQYPNLHAFVSQRAKHTSGPFERLK